MIYGKKLAKLSARSDNYKESNTIGSCTHVCLNSAQRKRSENGGTDKRKKAHGYLLIGTWSIEIGMTVTFGSENIAAKRSLMLNVEAIKRYISEQYERDRLESEPPKCQKEEPLLSGYQQ